ncbi:MAG TPA: hypothetical protein VMS37_27030 [Verrucomicrobiae bacterium]|nr:hypothetical protein [Verrucomicrobiae bacterium]
MLHYPRVPGCSILTNRKRVIVALVHTVVFLALAIYTAFLTVRPLMPGSPASAWIMTAVYLLVSAALLVLTTVSGVAHERLYFGLCTTSAVLGLGRQIAGDLRLHAAAPARVLLLTCAVLTGMAMLRATASTARR